MDAQELRALCLAPRGASEEFPFHPEWSVFKVGGKIFALTPFRDPLQVSVKCEPALGERLRATYAAIEPGYHLNKRHWLTITVDDDTVPDELIADLVEGSYELVVAGLPRAKQRALGLARA
jgi:predicted DNA-binding protein (MmcQ/YjbR family)